MAQSKTYHSKYKGVLVSSFTLKQFQSAYQKKRDEIVQELANELSYIGEECVKIAREDHANNWGDVTGNLRSSIGYEVLYNGKPVFTGAVKQYKGKSGNGEKGAPAARALLDKLAAESPYGVVLIVCAGMNYAAYVEAIHHKDVLTSAQMRAEQLIQELLDDYKNA